MHLETRAELSRVLMKRGLEPAGPQPTATHPWRCERTHLCQQCAHVQIRRTEQFQRPGGPTTFRQGRGFEHHRARIAARHPEIGRVGTRVDPRPRAERPPISRCGVRLPTLHRHDAAVDVEMESRHEPACKLSECQAVTHRHRAGADKAFATRPERQPFHRPAHRVRAIQNPYGLVLLRSRLEHVAQRGDERVDSAPDVLQIDEQNVEGIHHFGRRPAYFTVKAEDRDAVDGVGVVLRFDHVVLLVAAQSVLRAERRAQALCRRAPPAHRGNGPGCVLRKRGAPTEPRAAPPAACAARALRAVGRFQTS